MKMTYDADVDILYVRLENAQIVESDEVEEGIVYDFDVQGNVVGMEIQDASEHLSMLKAMPKPQVRLAAG